MNRLLAAIVVLTLSTATAFAQAPAAGRVIAGAAKPATAPLVEFEMMTWPEVKAALAAGKTTARRRSATRYCRPARADRAIPARHVSATASPAMDAGRRRSLARRRST